MSASKRIISELKRLADAHDGLLSPEAIVEAARPVSSPLHSRFEWDNSAAARKYRIWQARQLLKVCVEVVPNTKHSTNVFVSLTSDRKDGGYRMVTEVLTDAQMRRQMLSDALAELELFRNKYRELKELVVVFAAIRKVSKRRGG
jgi:uncharacterized protein YpbB